MNANNENLEDDGVLLEIAVRALADGMTKEAVMQWFAIHVQMAFEEYEGAELKALDIDGGTEPE